MVSWLVLDQDAIERAMGTWKNSWASTAHGRRASVARRELTTLSQEAGSMAMTRAVAVAVATTASSELVSEASRKARSPSR
jgi:hypothetical protein